MYLNPKLEKNCAKRAKNSISPPIFEQKFIFSGPQAIWKKLKQLLWKTQEKIQKLKQNENQVLFCSQKKCKIKTPAVTKYLICTHWRLFRQLSRSGGGCVSVGSIVLLEQCRQHPGHVPGASYPSRTGCCHHHRWSDRHRSPSKLLTGLPLFTFFTFSVLQSLEKKERPLVLLVNNFFRGGRFSEERTKVGTQPFNDM